MIVLGIDACLGQCAVALVRGEEVLARRVEVMARGHVERLAPMTQEVLEEADVSPAALDLIGVTCGPGGFTGARLGAAFARGLALAAGCRTVGVTTLEALAYPHVRRKPVVALDGRRNDLFVQDFRDGGAPFALPAEEFDDLVRRSGATYVIGPANLPAIDPVDVARLAARDPDRPPPSPLYLRAPDAKVAVPPVLR